MGRVWRWWFADRATGEITVAQFPNWPIWCIGACWLARVITDAGSTAHEALGWVIRGLWIVWGVDELVRGVNPWRRLLGTIVIAWQVVSLL